MPPDFLPLSSPAAAGQASNAPTRMTGHSAAQQPVLHAVWQVVAPPQYLVKVPSVHAQVPPVLQLMVSVAPPSVHDTQQDR